MRVFLSHSSADKPNVRRIAEALRSRGTAIWIDEAELRPGDSLAARLAEVMAGIDAFVIVVSKAAVESKWVAFELDLALARSAEAGIPVIPLVIDETPLPAPLAGLVFGDCRNPEGILRSTNALLKRAGLELPMSPEAVEARYADREPVAFGLRLVPTEKAKQSAWLGPRRRRYVVVGDYAEQAGRSLREILSNLWFGDAYDQVSRANLDWTAVVFELGGSNRRKYDLLPGTWKAVFRAVSDRKRLGLIEPAPEERERMGVSPRDYCSQDQEYWYGRLRTPAKGPDGEEAWAHPAAMLHDLFGISSLCFWGTGITRESGGREGAVARVPSRVFIMKNEQLRRLGCRLQRLGHADDGNVLV